MSVWPAQVTPQPAELGRHSPPAMEPRVKRYADSAAWSQTGLEMSVCYSKKTEERRRGRIKHWARLEGGDEWIEHYKTIANQILCRQKSAIEQLTGEERCGMCCRRLASNPPFSPHLFMWRFSSVCRWLRLLPKSEVIKTVRRLANLCLINKSMTL